MLNTEDKNGHFKLDHNYGSNDYSTIETNKNKKPIQLANKIDALQERSTTFKVGFSDHSKRPCTTSGRKYHNYHDATVKSCSFDKNKTSKRMNPKKIYSNVKLEVNPKIAAAYHNFLTSYKSDYKGYPAKH